MSALASHSLSLCLAKQGMLVSGQKLVSTLDPLKSSKAQTPLSTASQVHCWPPCRIALSVPLPHSRLLHVLHMWLAQPCIAPQSLPVCLSEHMSVLTCMFIGVSGRPCAYYVAVHLSVYVSAYLFVYTSVCLPSACLFVCPSVCASERGFCG